MARHLLTRPHHDTDADRGTDVERGTARESRTDAGDQRARDTGEHLVPVTPYDDYRGTNWGACFFGWLVAVGVTLILAGIATAVVAALGAAQGWTWDDAKSHAGTAGLAGVIALGVIELVGYYAGGYVAGRMSRFDAGRQGLGVWLIGLLTLVIASGVTAIFGDRYSWADRVDRSSIDLTDTQLTLGGVIAAVAVLVVMLVGALLGSAVGRRYHRRIDRVIVQH
jgi:hypothetical protein